MASQDVLMPFRYISFKEIIVMKNKQTNKNLPFLPEANGDLSHFHYCQHGVIPGEVVRWAWESCS